MPVGAPVGSFWWESDSGLLYLLYDDGTGAPQWVIACPQPDPSVSSGGSASVLVSDTPPVDAADNSLWWESDSGLLFIRYNDGVDSPQWVLASPSASTVPAVRYDAAQSLSATQQTQARQNIYAAPFDALAYNGMQFNGSMEVNQEYGVTGTTLANAQKYIADGFMCAIVGGAFTIYGSNPIGSLPGFQNAVYLNVTTANALTAGDYQCILHPIEGYRWARLFWGAAQAQPVTISFWVYATVSGTMAVGVRNAATNRNYRVDVSVSNAGWQYRTVTIPGCPDGTWDKTNGVGATIIFGFGAGSGLKGPADTWATSNLLGTTATTNFCGTIGNQIYLTGVTVLPGTQAPTAAQSPYIMRPYDQELVTCQRYWESGQEPTFYYPVGGTVTAIYYSVPFVATKRANPTMTLTGWTYYSGGSGASFSPAANGLLSSFFITATGLTSCNGLPGNGSWIANARL